MGMVDMGVHPKESPQDGFGGVHECRWESHSYTPQSQYTGQWHVGTDKRTDLLREMLLVVQDGLCPCHECLDICWCGEVCGLLAAWSAISESPGTKAGGRTSSRRLPRNTRTCEVGQLDGQNQPG